MTGHPPDVILAAQAEAAATALDLVNLLFVLLAAWGAGQLAIRIGYPAILGELLAGIVLGPALLGLLHGGPGIAVIAELGVILMMLYIGMEVDPGDLRRASVPGLLAAIGGFVVPFGLGYLTVILFGGDAITGLFVAAAVGVTSLATKSRILSDLELFDTRIAYVLMAGALVSDTATLVVFAAIVGFVELGAFDLGATAQVGAEALGFFAVTAALGLGPVRWLGRWLRGRRARDRSLYFALIVTVGLVFAELAELAGLHAILGAFVAGLYVRDDVLGPRAFRDVSSLLHLVSIRFLAPIFFVTVGFQITFDVFRTDLALLVAIFAVAVLGKVVGTALFYLPTGHGWREGLTLGAAMNGRGAVEIVVAGIGLRLGLISQEIFTILVFMAIATTALVPFLLTVGVRWLRGRGELERTVGQRRAVVIVGAGPASRAIARALQPLRPVVLIDVNAAHCRAAQEEGLSAVHGDVLDEDTLQEAEAERAGALLALTTNAEVNLLAAQLARDEFGVPNVQAAVGASLTPMLQAMIEESGGTILLGRPVEIHLWDRWVELDRVRRTNLPITEAMPVEDFVSSIGAGVDTLPTAVERGDDVLVFPAAGTLEAGDEVMILVRSDRPDPTLEPTGETATA